MFISPSNFKLSLLLFSAYCSMISFLSIFEHIVTMWLSEQTHSLPKQGGIAMMPQSDHLIIMLARSNEISSH